MTDSRTIFANAELAHSSLRCQVKAASFVDGVRMRVASPVLDIQDATGATLARQALFGGPVHVLNPQDKMPFLRCETTGYVGYLRWGQLAEWLPPTHRVAVRQTLAFSRPSFKTPSPQVLPFGAQVAVEGQEGRFVRTKDGAFIPRTHLQPIDSPETDPVSVAELHLGVPYLWGGNSSLGIDCSGLAQVAFTACGVSCPGDSDLQEAVLGETLPAGATPQRGDLFFWKGHVALAVNEAQIIHANATDMAVVYEGLGDAITRIEAQGEGPVTRHARLTLFNGK